MDKYFVAWSWMRVRSVEPCSRINMQLQLVVMGVTLCLATTVPVFKYPLTVASSPKRCIPPSWSKLPGAQVPSPVAPSQ